MVTARTNTRHKTLAEQAVAELQEAILVGDLAPGMPLRLERLGELLEMSAMPVREAIRQLERLGLAEHVPHRGARVSLVSTEDLRDTYEARLAVEGVAVRQAASRFRKEHERLCRGLLDEHVRAFRADDDRRSRELHTDFHFALYEASGSQWLPRLIRPLWQNSERYRARFLYTRDSLELRRREHEGILEACVANDADRAEDALRTHLLRTVDVVAERMSEREALRTACTED